MVCEDLLNHIIPSLAKKQKDSPDFNLPDYVLIRLCQMSGYIALKQLNFMDDTMYKELKRRNHMQEEKKKKNDGATSGKKKQKKNVGRKSVQANTAIQASLLNASMVSSPFFNICY